MERYAKGELTLWDLVGIYEWEFDAAVPEKFPSTKYCKDMRKLYYDQGLEYLKNFAGYDDRKILEVESQFDYEIDDWTFNGVIDLVFEDKDVVAVLIFCRARLNDRLKRCCVFCELSAFLSAAPRIKSEQHIRDHLMFAAFLQNFH